MGACPVTQHSRGSAGRVSTTRACGRYAIIVRVSLLACLALGLGALTICSTPPGPITHGSRAIRAVALTFDACETKHPAGYDQAIIRILRATRTPATLFLGGKWMQSHPRITRALAREPLFELANHSYLHPHLTRLREAAIRDEIRRTQDIMFSLAGRRGQLFRAPYGEYDGRVIRIAAQLGLTTVQWEVVSGDPDRGVTARRMVEAVASRARNGSIIIMHMNGRGWHTAEALPTIIARLRARGYALMTVSDLLRAARQPGLAPAHHRPTRAAP
jgi:peptidoglycan/xylan/chitin deacetylase (PgdA/CDA1 family)